MRRLLLPSLAAAALVLVVAALAGVGRPEAARGDTGTPDTVTTVGHGVVTVAPDRATVSAGVHTQAATASAALAENAARMNAVVAALKTAGGEDLQTQEVSLYPQSDDTGKVTGYTADDSVAAEIDVAKAGALVDAAVEAGANTVNGPALSVSDQDARYRDALKKAVEDARAKAQALAEAGGFGVGPVSVVSEESDASQPVFRESAVAAKAADAPTPIEAGTQEIAADVTVTFRIR
jgi:uncharacterized protein YggE